MGVIRSLLAFVVVVLITTSLVAGNAVIAVDRTAANEEFVTSTLEEEDAYAEIQSVASDEAAGQVDQSDIPVSIDTRAVVNDTLEQSYLQNQTEANVRRAFAFLEGDSEDLNLSVDLAPVKRSIADVVEDRIANQSVGELIDIVSEDRDLSTEVAGIGIDLRIVANLSEGPESYNDARESFRNDIRDAVVERLASESYNESVNNQEYDPLLQLVIEDYDPSNYTEDEKATLVDDRESEIKTELEAEIQANRGDEISNQVDQQLQEINTQINNAVADEVESTLADSDYSQVSEPATELLVVGANGLTSNQSYSEFDSDLSTAKANLASNVSIIVRNRLDEQVDDRFDLLNNDQISDADRAEIESAAENARDGYGTLGLLTFVLPIVSLVLIGLLYLITRSFSTTAILSGIPALLVGGATYAVASAAPGEIESPVRSELQGSDVPENVVDLLLGITEQVLGVVAGQSLVLALVGVGLIVAGIANSVRNRGSGGEETEMYSDGGRSDGEMDGDGGGGDDEDYNETETIMDPEPGGASDSGGGDDEDGSLNSE
jgi:CHASE3 domain sensor protein